MAEIHCADVSCKYNLDDGTCAAESVKLSWHNVMTYWDGRQEFLKCQTREDSELAKRTAEYMKTVKG